MTRRADNFINLPIPSKEETHFDLSVLLKQDNLDIRDAAANNPSLTVGGYRELLQQFIDLAPDILGVIKKFARQDFNLAKKDYKNLEQMLSLLEKIKCDKFAVDFQRLPQKKQLGIGSQPRRTDI
jgi:phage FluMu protein gp41